MAFCRPRHLPLKGAFMKKQIMNLISYILTLLLLLSAITACAISPDDITENPESSGAATNGGNLSESSTDEITSDGEPEVSSDVLPAESETEGEPEVNEPIIADLNNDGIDDQILIVFDDVAKTAATIKVIDGKDASELMSESLSLTSNKKGAYYLKIGKNGNYDELVFWSYNYLSTGGMAFKYSIFNFSGSGDILYDDREEYRFDLGSGIASGNMVFITMREAINGNILPNGNSHDSYLLLDNQGDQLQYSTVDDMLTPTELTFTLNDFVVEADAE